ncbi:hypothetical protein ACWCXX_26565, partial [Streptomyces sp. NPDC001732]
PTRPSSNRLQVSRPYPNNDNQQLRTRNLTGVLGDTALTIGAVWLVIGIVYLAFLTRGFRRPAPEMTFDDDAEGPAEDTATATC